MASRVKVLNIIKTELLEDKEKYGDERKTQILPDQGEVTIEDLTPNTPMAVFITHQGYLKRISLDTFERQNRATRGKGGMKTKENDDVEVNMAGGFEKYVSFKVDSKSSEKLTIGAITMLTEVE